MSVLMRQAFSQRRLSIRRLIAVDNYYTLPEFSSDYKVFGTMVMGKYQGSSVANRPMADATIQFVVLQESAGADGENRWTGHTLTAVDGATTRTYTFSHDLPGGSCDYYGMCMPSPTAHRYVFSMRPPSYE